MNWRTHLTPGEIEALTALEAQLREGYNEDLEYRRRRIIARGHTRQTALNRRKKNMIENMTDLEAATYHGIKAAQRLAHKTATDAGWYRDPHTGEPIVRNFGEVVALMHSELSEALEADRKGLNDDKLTHRDGREVEFADCIIRILDTCAALGLDVAGAIIEKNRYNRDRADHKLANRAAGGKRY